MSGLPVTLNNNNLFKIDEHVPSILQHPCRLIHLDVAVQFTVDDERLAFDADLQMALCYHHVQVAWSERLTQGYPYLVTIIIER